MRAQAGDIHAGCRSVRALSGEQRDPGFSHVGKELTLQMMPSTMPESSTGTWPRGRALEASETASERIGPRGATQLDAIRTRDSLRATARPMGFFLFSPGMRFYDTIMIPTFFTRFPIFSSPPRRSSEHPFCPGPMSPDTQLLRPLCSYFPVPFSGALRLPRI